MTMNIYLQSEKGGLAHLVERKHGMFEVTGSIPVSSTTSQRRLHKRSRLCYSALKINQLLYLPDNKCDT